MLQMFYSNLSNGSWDVWLTGSHLHCWGGVARGIETIVRWREDQRICKDPNKKNRTWFYQPTDKFSFIHLLTEEWRKTKLWFIELLMFL